jgi:hypothetical protein
LADRRARVDRHPGLVDSRSRAARPISFRPARRLRKLALLGIDELFATVAEAAWWLGSQVLWLAAAVLAVINIPAHGPFAGGVVSVLLALAIAAALAYATIISHRAGPADRSRSRFTLVLRLAWLTRSTEHWRGCRARLRAGATRT